MNERPPAPRRAYELTLKVGADSLEALCGYLHSFETELYMNKISTGVSGGYSAGAEYSLTVDPSRNHETWVVELEAYIAWIDANRQAKSEA